MDWFEYLKSPELVVTIQEYFGIRYKNRKPTCDKSDKIRSQQYRDNDDGGSNSSKETDQKAYIITNKFYYYLFLIATSFGDELFYATSIPFWFWNIDSFTGRRVVSVWATVMYIGQTLKDIIKWERPGYPVEKLQKKWSLEYGMPSTHAMIALSIPFSIILFTMDRYVYSIKIGLMISIIWCTVICVSRLYLGMHTVLDIIAGLLLTVLLMIPLIPIIDKLDAYLLSSNFSPIIVLALSIGLIVFYPNPKKFTPTRADTTITTSFWAGVQVGAWIMYNTDSFYQTSLPPPYEIIWPSHGMLGLILLRTVLGLCCIVATRAIGKSISYAFVCFLLGKDKNELRNSENSLENKDKITVDLSYKFFTYGMIGLNTQFLIPKFFKLLDIGRPDYYTEM